MAAPTGMFLLDRPPMSESANDAVAASGEKPKSSSNGPIISTKQLVFTLSARQKQSEARFSIGSASSTSYAYKIKTTAPKRFCVRPNQGFIMPGQTVEISVSFLLERILQECQSKAFDFNAVALTMSRDKFLVQTVALTAEDSEQPPAQAAQLLQSAAALEEQGRKQEAEALKVQAEELQHLQWASFKSAKRVVDCKIGLNFVEATRSSSAREDDTANAIKASAPRANVSASPHEAAGGNSVSKSTAPALGRGSSVGGEDGMSAELIAENLRLRTQLESQKEVLAQTTEALQVLKAQVDLRSRRPLETMSEAEAAKAAAGIAGTVYDKKTDIQSSPSSSKAAQVLPPYRLFRSSLMNPAVAVGDGHPVCGYCMRQVRWCLGGVKSYVKQ
jgi:hypothetical protein